MARHCSSIIQVTNEQKIAIRKDVKLDNEQDIEKSINEILEWYEHQQHLPRIPLDPVIIERFLISRKGSVSQTKEKIDSMFTIRNTISKLAAPRDVHHPDIKRVFDAILVAPLPRLNHDNTRVNFSRYTADANSYNIADAARYLFMTMDYRLKYDYTSGDRFVVDMKHKTWKHFTKEMSNIVIHIDKYMKEGYGLRMKGIHVINAPIYISSIIQTFKLILPKKLMDRVQVHKTIETLYEIIDKDILPEEYGGREKPLQELMSDWYVEMGKEHVRKFLKRQETLRSDESKRIK